MEFMFLMLDGEVIRDWTEAQQSDAVARMAAFTGPLRAAGIYRDSGGLGPDFGAARVRVTDGQASVVDGPFAGAAQLVGGFLVVECASRDEAIEPANAAPRPSGRRWRSGSSGGIESRHRQLDYV
jgi:hypothetical protein